MEDCLPLYFGRQSLDRAECCTGLDYTDVPRLFALSILLLQTQGLARLAFVCQRNQGGT